MMKTEFEKQLCDTISDKNYQVVNYIYNFHPSISNTEGKRQIAELYKLGGMRLMYDMLSTAKEAEELETKISKTNAELAKLKQQYEDLLHGHTPMKS